MLDLNSVNRLIASVWSELEAVELIGSGVSGSVYKTVSRGVVSALKVIRIPQSPNEIPAIGQNELLRERANAQYSAAVNALFNVLHLQQSLGAEPNILSVYEYTAVPCEDGIGSYVLVRTECLNSVDRLGEFSPLQAIQLGIDMCAALEVCERSHIRHGNIKPGNIFVNDQGVYKLGDIGIAGVFGGGAAGSGGFAAPEVYGGGAGDIRSDIFSVGAIVYFLLGHRQLPFYISHGQPLAASRVMTPELNMLLATACADNPSDRYQTAASMKQELINLYTSMVFGDEPAQNDEQSSASAAFVPAEADDVSANGTAAAVGAGIAAGAVGAGADDGADGLLKSVFSDQPSASDPDTTVSVYENKEAPAPADTESTVGVRSDNAQTAETKVFDVSGGADTQYSTADTGTFASVGGASHQNTTEFVSPTPKLKKPEKPKKTGADKKKKTAVDEDDKKHASLPIIIISLVVIVAVLAALGFGIYWVVETIRGLSFEGYSPDDENAPDPIEIEITSLPDKLEYYSGEPINTTGLVFEAKYDDFRSVAVSEGYTIDKNMFLDEGTHEVTVTYRNQTDTFEITVVAADLVDLQISRKPDKLNYVYNQDIDFTGLELAAYYSDGAVLLIDEGYEVSAEVAEEMGTQVITVTYGMRTVNFSVNVIEKSVESVSIKTLPNKLEYTVGQSVDPEGLLLNVVYSNGISAAVSSEITITPEVLDTVGVQTVFVNYGGIETAFEVTVTEAEVVGISVETMPSKLDYVEGEALSLEGMVLTEDYSNGSMVEITDGYTYLPTSAETVGAQVVTVYYGEFSTTFNVVVKKAPAAVSSVSVATNPKQLSYNVGDTVYTSGLTLTVKYTDGTSRNITGGFTYTPTELKSAGKQYITVTYGGKSTGYYVTVTEKKVASVSVKTEPAKLSYYVGDTVYTSGLKLTVKYTDGTSKDITGGFTYSPTELKSAGKQYITVNYGGKSTGYYVTVNEASPTSLKVKTMPSKTEYYVGDTVDGSGLTLTLGYSGGATETVTGGFVLTDTALNKVGTHTVKVSYKGLTASFNVNVTMRPVSASGSVTSTMSWSIDNNTLTISGSGVMNDFTYLGAPWQKYADSIKTVNIQSGVLSISSNAFTNLPVETISIPDSVTLIDDDAIYLCGNLRTISVSTSNRAYASQSGYLYSKDLTKLLVYPTGRGEAVVTLPSSTKIIDGYRVFAGSAITELIITESVYSIDETAFYGADKLEKITVRSRNTTLVSVDGVLYNKSMSELMCYPAAKKDTSATIPDSVKFIRAYAFSNNSKLESLVVPNTVQEIGHSSFTGMKSLRSVLFMGSEDKWDDIFIGNDNSSLTNARIIFNG